MSVSKNRIFWNICAFFILLATRLSNRFSEYFRHSLITNVWTNVWHVWPVMYDYKYNDEKKNWPMLCTPLVWATPSFSAFLPPVVPSWEILSSLVIVFIFMIVSIVFLCACLARFRSSSLLTQKFVTQGWQTYRFCGTAFKMFRLLSSLPCWLKSN